MKSNKFLIATLLILVGIGAITVSCKKEKNRVRRAQMIVDVNNCTRDGGDDDEEPIIQGKIKKKISFAIVDSALVETVAYGTNVSIGSTYSGELGEFEQKVDAGAYYFKITAQGEVTPYITDTIHVNKDLEVTILID